MTFYHRLIIDTAVIMNESAQKQPSKAADNGDRRKYESR